MAIRILELLILFVILTGAAAVVIGALLVLTGKLQLGSFKTCPHCAERIRQAARICRYCQREVTGSDFENRPKGLFQ
jgi:hypothetical protein